MSQTDKTLVTTPDGDFKIHSKSICEGACPFHNPSEHPLNKAKIHIRGDKMMLVERICEHGIGHDDPDSVAYFHSKGEKWAGTHGCDGCCTKPSESEELETPDDLNSLLDNYESHTRGSHSDDWGGDSDKPCFCDLKAKIQSLYQSQLEKAVAEARIKSDSFIFKILHKYSDEIIKDYTNFSGRDNTPMITGRYALKIKDAVNAELQHQLEGKNKND